MISRLIVSKLAHVGMSLASANRSQPVFYAIFSLHFPGMSCPRTQAPPYDIEADPAPLRAAINSAERHFAPPTLSIPVP
jgi:hypothetical protein